MNNPSLGYYTYGLPEVMSYSLWRESEELGKYCWYHKDGTARIYFPHDYNWKNIYDKVIQYTDLMFSFRMIYDVESFTCEFLALIPMAWLQFKTQLELITGSLEGTTIDPNIFEQGYTRELWEDFSRNINDTFKNTGLQNEDVNLGKREDTLSGEETENIDLQISDDSKARGIGYNQGVQAYNNMIHNNNIGELGNDYASQMQDNVSVQENRNTTEREVTSENSTTIGAQHNNTDINVENEGNSAQDEKQDLYQKTKETRINYYDNLAFLRERMEQLRHLKQFHEYFMHLFIHVESMVGWWKF